jgi:hypothetical protein
MQTDSNNPDRLASANNEPNPGKFLIPRSQRQKFFFQFTLMTVIGWVVGGIASIAIEKMILQNLVLEPQIWNILVRCLSNVVFATIFAADQAFVLYRYLSGWKWIFGTSVGWLIANGVSTAWINYISSIALSNQTLSPEQTFLLGFMSAIAYILSGIWLGICQWLVLRRYTASAWWWNFLPSISFFLITILVWFLFLLQNFIPEANRNFILYWSGQGFTAIILGAIPAIGLCNLKRNSPRPSGISP